jgi:hypothetical protein
MRRRLDLASSLLVRPRLLFLDEPTTGLDPRSRNAIWEVTRELVAEGTTLLLTTQYLEEADVLADRIAVIDHGRIIAEGTGDELKDRTGGQVIDVLLAKVRTIRERAARSAVARVPRPARTRRLLVHVVGDDALATLAASPSCAPPQVAVRDVGPAPSHARRRLPRAHRHPGDRPCVGVRRTGATPRSVPDMTEEPTLADRATGHAGAAPTRRPALWWTARDTFTVTKRNLRHFVRQPRLLVFSTIQPVMFVVLFAFVFGGVAATALPEGVAYIEFLLPGLFIQSAAFRSTQTAVGLAEDLERGVIDRFRSMPMSRVAVLAGTDLRRPHPQPQRRRADGRGRLPDRVPVHRGGHLRDRCRARRRAVRLRARVDLHLHGPGGPRRRGRADRRLRDRLPAGVRELHLRAGRDHAELAAGVRRQQPGVLAADATRALSIGGPVTRPLLLTLVWAVVILAIAIPASVRRYRRMT